MSEVQRYYVGEYGLVEGEALGRLSVVLATDFDRVTAERDALQALLTAADERADVLESVSVKQAALLDELGISLNEVDDLFGETLKNAKRYEYLRSVMAVENFPGPHPEWSEPSEFDSKRIDDLCDAALKQAEAHRNQCDGCQAGVPVVNGAHRMGKPGGYADTMSCTAKMYVEERPDGCCCPPKGHTGLWGAAMCPVHQGLRALKR